MTAALTQRKKAKGPTQRVNQRRFTESILLLEMVNCFKMYVIKIKKERKRREMKIKRKHKTCGLAAVRTTDTRVYTTAGLTFTP